MNSGCLLRIAIALCGLVAVAGCGGDGLDRENVSGTVKVDGVPVEAGTISFTPVEASTTSSGGPITAGQYSLTGNAGLAPGKYKVVIHAPKPGTGQTPPEDAMPGDPLEPPEELIPPEWNVNSAQTIEVKTGENSEFNFEIASK